MLKFSFELLGHDGPIYSACIDQKFLYSGSADKFVARWDLISQKQDSFSIKTDSVPISLETAESQFLIMGLLNGELHIVDLITKQEVFSCNLDSNGIFSLMFNPFHKTLYVGTGSGILYVFSIPDFKQILMLPIDCGKIRKFLMDKNGKLLYFVSQDGFIRCFDTKTFNEKLSCKVHEGGANSLTLLTNTTIITGGKDGFLRLWNLNSKKEIFGFPAHKAVIYDIIKIPGYIISVSRDKSIKIWNEKTMDPVQKISYHRHSVNAFVQHNEGSFVSVSDDKKIVIWTNEF